MRMNKPIKYVTVPIFYVNSIPHVGHAYAMVLGDIYARYHNAILINGTDEHGQKVATAAKKNNQDPQDYVDEIHTNFKDLISHLDIKDHIFIRTTSEKHKKIAKKIWNTLIDNKSIYLGRYDGWYSESDECFYKENELDQDGNAPTGSKVQYIEEECYFFHLPKFRNQILEYLHVHDIYPESRRQESINFVNSGLYDLAVSRRISWGIPIEKDHVIYVWIDALSSYIEPLFDDNVTEDILSEEERLKINKNDLWKNSLHIVGKDISRFHTIYWIGILLALRINPPSSIYIHGWWTVKGQKMSKSVGNVIDPKSIIDEFGSDVVRFTLLREPNFGEDAEIDKSRFIESQNLLANKFSNLVYRFLSMAVNKNFREGEVLIDTTPIIELEKNPSEYVRKTIEFCDILNKFIQDNKVWENDKYLYTLYKGISLMCNYCDIIIPSASGKWRKQLEGEAQVEIIFKRYE